MNPDLEFPADEVSQRVRAEAGAGKVDEVNATRLATALMGDSIAANLFMLGFAYQRGLVPVTAAAIEQAIEMNGLAIPMNKGAFAWGRRAAHNIAAVEAVVSAGRGEEAQPETVEALIARRAADLLAYQDEAYARRFETLVNRVKTAETALGRGDTALTEAVARGLYKLMAYKDEYEVARLYSDPAWRQDMESQLEGAERLELLLAPPLLSKPDPVTGRIQKRAFGPWIFPVLRQLAKLKGLRGGAFDIFGKTEERRTERALIGDYETMIGELIEGLKPESYAVALAVAKVPETIRGYGHVKAPSVAAARQEWERLMRHYRDGSPLAEAAE